MFAYIMCEPDLVAGQDGSDTWRYFLGDGSPYVAPQGKFNPSVVTRIDDKAFLSSGLVKVVIPDSVKEIGQEAFYKCKFLKEVVIGNSVEMIGASAFYKSGLEKMVIPDSVREIGEDSFYGCKSLKVVVIGNSVEEIGDSAFYGCEALKEVFIGNSGTDIEWRSYFPEGCTVLFPEV